MVYAREGRRAGNELVFELCSTNKRCLSWVHAELNMHSGATNRQDIFQQGVQTGKSPDKIVFMWYTPISWSAQAWFRRMNKCFLKPETPEPSHSYCYSETNLIFRMNVRLKIGCTKEKGIWTQVSWEWTTKKKSKLSFTYTEEFKFITFWVLTFTFIDSYFFFNNKLSSRRELLC